MAASRPDVVVHAAGRTEGPPAALLADNAIATANLAVAMSDAAPGAGLVLLGSAAQYGAGEPGHPWRETDPCLPQGPYGISKQAAETCAFARARRSGLKIAALRLFNVVSPVPQGEQALAHFQRKAAVAASGPPPWRIRMGALGAVRDFVALDDVLEAVARTIDRGAWGEAINVCTGLGRPVRALIEQVASELPGEVVVEESADQLPGALWSVGDPGLCEARLGFRPSADLAPVARAAAAWVKREAAAHARSRA
jgi:nucleoside-diphosphate-sugar epimerase